MRKRDLFLISMVVLVVVLPAVLVNLIPPPKSYLEIYRIEEEGNARTCYLKWHGPRTEMKLCVLGDAPMGNNWTESGILNNGDAFWVMFNRYNGWAQIDYDDKTVVVHNTGELEEYPFP